MPIIRLTWNASLGAVSYNLYHALTPGLSTALTPLLTNVISLSFDHTVIIGQHYYIVAAVGPNGEIGARSIELSINAAQSGHLYGRGQYGRILWG